MSVHVGAFCFKGGSAFCPRLPRPNRGARFNRSRPRTSLVHTVIEQEDRFVKMGPFLHDSILSAACREFGQLGGASGTHRLPLESSADPNGQTDSVGQNYGGGAAMRIGAVRGLETKHRGRVAPKGRTDTFYSSLVAL